ncbi:hypothetical protein FRC01_000328, partial [Tulasnella sp. 417]
MSAPNLTPEQQNLFSLIQLFESTGGSEGYLRHLEAIQSATENAPQIDKNKEGLIYSEVGFTIAAMKGCFTVDVTTKHKGVGSTYYEGKGYGHAPGAIDGVFSGSLILPSWAAVIAAGPIPFKVVKGDGGDPDLIDFECYIDGKVAVSFGGVAPGEEALVGSTGLIS